MGMIEKLFKDLGVGVGLIVLIIAIAFVVALYIGAAWMVLNGVSIFYPIPITFASLTATSGLLCVIKFLLSK